jgi:hypothetical protein
LGAPRIRLRNRDTAAVHGRHAALIGGSSAKKLKVYRRLSLNSLRNAKVIDASTRGWRMPFRNVFDLTSTWFHSPTEPLDSNRAAHFFIRSDLLVEQGFLLIPVIQIPDTSSDDCSCESKNGVDVVTRNNVWLQICWKRKDRNLNLG